MKPFELRLDILMIRFYLMMAVIITSFFIGIPMLSIIALPIFLSALMGVTFKGKSTKKAVQKMQTRTLESTTTKAA